MSGHWTSLGKPFADLKVTPCIHGVDEVLEDELHVMHPKVQVGLVILSFQRLARRSETIYLLHCRRPTQENNELRSQVAQLTRAAERLSTEMQEMELEWSRSQVKYERTLQLANRQVVEVRLLADERLQVGRRKRPRRRGFFREVVAREPSCAEKRRRRHERDLTPPWCLVPIPSG